MNDIQKIPEEATGKLQIAGKPNFLIESQQGFKNVHEYRLFLSMLYMAYDGVDLSKSFELDISYIIAANRGGSDYECIKEACMNIMNRIVNLLPNEKRGFKLRHLVDKADYSELSGSGKLRVSFHPDVVPHIVSMFKEGKYTKIFLKHALPIRSLYSVRVYEILLQYKGFGFRDIDLTDFRFMVDIDDKYKHWINLKQRILLPAQKHLRKYTDITFEFFPIQKGRKVFGIHFIIQPNNPDYNADEEQLNLFEDDKEHSVKQIAAETLPEHERIVHDCIWKESQKEVLEIFSKERIIFYYKHCRKLEASGKKIADFNSFFYRALYEDREDFERKLKESLEKKAVKRKEDQQQQAKKEAEDLKILKAEKYFSYLPYEIKEHYLKSVHPMIPINMKDGMAAFSFMEEFESYFIDEPEIDEFNKRVLEISDKLQAQNTKR